jgi:hypothetical protein
LLSSNVGFIFCFSLVFPDGIFRGSGNKEFYNDCSSECIKRKEFRNLSLRLPHFSLSQMMVSFAYLKKVGFQRRKKGAKLQDRACSVE